MTSLLRIHKQDDFLTQFGLRDSLQLALPWIKRDFLLKPWSRETRDFKSRLGKNLGAVMTSNSDFGIGVSSYKRFKNIYGHKTKLIATNVLDSAVRAYPNAILPVPIGLTDYIKGSSNHELFSDIEAIREAFERQYGKPKKPTIAINFSTSTHYSRRFAMREAIASRFCEVGEMELTRAGRISALTLNAQSLGVLCPRGNGLDTHRLWETLYTGGVPVVRAGDFSKHLLQVSNLPHLEIGAWKDLSSPRTIERLEEIVEDLPNRDFSKLGQEFWRSTIIDFLI